MIDYLNFLWVKLTDPDVILTLTLFLIAGVLWYKALQMAKHFKDID